jgi:two-component system, sensor histidine kinase PdtaS
MSVLGNLLEERGASPFDVEWFTMLLRDWQLLADLSVADVVLWVPDDEGQFVAATHARPSGAATLFYRDFVGQKIRPEWRAQVQQAFDSQEMVDSSAPAWFEETPTRVQTIPVVRPPRPQAEETEKRSIAVISVHTNLSESRLPSRQEQVFHSCADDLFAMIASGTFPDLEAAPEPKRGAPRASDGLIRLDVDGDVAFASPNAASAFNRVGYKEELEGESLSEVTTQVLSGKINIDESLPLVVSGRAPWRAEIEAGRVTIALRAIPLRRGSERIGAIVLCRDVSELRNQERELMTKDATIREIHHRVKNNLQTVASLLRIQARRSQSDEAKDALTQAMRRVASIAVVHDTLSEGLNQNVDFDDVFERVLGLVAEVAAMHGTTAHTSFTGSFGSLPSTYATPLSLALTELVTNAVEHGLAGREGTVVIDAQRDDDQLHATITDNGIGLTDGSVSEGLGTQIVRTLIEGELSGSIEWESPAEGGTRVRVSIPLRFMKETGMTAVTVTPV